MKPSLKHLIKEAQPENDVHEFIFCFVAVVLFYVITVFTVFVFCL